jgi:acyl-CoA reductase-like NAD-dependent aldehyde dehydrogenase
MVAVAFSEKFEAGMASVNDLTITYMCQSLPFGGVKQSGFDCIAGSTLQLDRVCTRYARFFECI